MPPVRLLEPLSPTSPNPLSALGEAGERLSGDCHLVASYPRSGNKFMRSLLCAYATVYDSRTDAPEYKTVTITPRGVVMSPAGGADALNEARLMGETALLAKTHAGSWPRRCALSAVIRIYMVRHPLDVLASALNFFIARGLTRPFRGAAPDSLESLIQGGDIQAQIDAFIGKRGHPYYARSFGAWLDHVMSWSARGPLTATHVVRYEDLAADPKSALASVFARHNAHFNPDRADLAIKAAMTQRKIELGRAGGYLKDVLSPAQKAAARDAFAPALDRFEYEIA